jgi:hypothetical protein
MIAVDAFVLMVLLIFFLNLYIFLLLYVGWLLEKKMVSVRYVIGEEHEWVFLGGIR